MFDGFWFGVVVGVIAGGFFVDVNLRLPETVKSWFANVFDRK